MPVLAPSSSAVALLLGVTPEIARLASTLGIRMLAVDRTLEMIQLIWPRTELRDGAAVCGDWTTIPLPNRSVSCVVGDGCFTLLRHPDGYRRIFAEMHRLLIPGGRFAMRFFCRPIEREALAQIEDDLTNRRIGNIHVLKWRVAMALQNTIQEGVAVDKIWHAISAMVPDRDQLGRVMGWSRNEIDTFDVFRGSPATFTFPTLDEIREISGLHFLEASIHVPSYELGPLCPTVVYKPLSAD